MAHNELWQVFADTGEPISGKFGSRQDFASDKSLIMGASHIWIWRRSGETVEVLLQTRSSTKSTWPGFKDISAAGHIDQGESPVVAAVRETKEEIGLDINPSLLYFLFSFRTPLDSSEIDTVFLYELGEDTGFTFNDGEVESLEWVELSELAHRFSEPEKYNIVPQGREYFGLLLAALRRILQ